MANCHQMVLIVETTKHLFYKSSRFLQFGTNLPLFGPKCDILEKQPAFYIWTDLDDQ